VTVIGFVPLTSYRRRSLWKAAEGVGGIDRFLCRKGGRRTVSIAFIAGPVAVFGLAWLISSFRIVRSGQRAVVERFGRYRRTIDPGVRFALRFVERLRRVDVRERVEDVALETLNRDHLPIHLDVAVFYRCVEPRAFVYDVADPGLAINRSTESEVRSLVAKLTLEQLLGSDEIVSAELQGPLADMAGAWGVALTRVEVARIDPPQDIAEAQVEIATAERERLAIAVTRERELQAAMGQAEVEDRREDVRAKGEQRRRLAAAETDRAIAVLRAEAEAQADRIQADAARYREQCLAQAHADAVKIVASAVQASAGNDLIAVKYLEVLTASSTGPAIGLALGSADELAVGDLARRLLPEVPDEPDGGAVHTDVQTSLGMV
jgi:regulator of protease activity HflC (stomatin/prohibitin superfamily)